MIESKSFISHTNEFWWKKGIFVNQGKKHTKYGGYIFGNILDICRISPSSVIIHKSVFEKVGFFDESLRACEDYELWLRVALKYEILYLSEKTIVKRFFLKNHLSVDIKHLEFLRLLALNKLLFEKNIFNYSDLKKIYFELNKKFDIVYRGLNKY
jgi:GT2 family glycosyltransferase